MTTAPTTNFQAKLEMANSPVEEAYIILDAAYEISRVEQLPLAEVLDRIGMLGEEEPTH